MQILPEIPQPTPRVRPEPPEPSRGPGFDDAMREAGARERRDDAEPRTSRPVDDRPAESARPHADGAERRSETQDRASTADRETRIDDPRSDRAETGRESDHGQDTTQADATPAEASPVDEAPIEDDRQPDQSVEAAPSPVETSSGDVAPRTDAPDLTALASAEDAPPAATTTAQPDSKPAADATLKPAIADDLAGQPEVAPPQNQTAKSDAMINGVDPEAAGKTDIPVQEAAVRPSVVPGPSPSAAAAPGPVTADPAAPAPAAPPIGTPPEAAAMTSQQVAAAAKTNATGSNETADLTADDPKPAAQPGERARPPATEHPADMPDEAMARGPAKKFNVSELIPTAQPANSAGAKAEPAPPAAMTAALADPSLGQLQPGAGLSTITTGTGSVNTVSAAAAQSAYTRGGEAAQPPAQQVAIQISRAVQEGTDRITVQLKPAALGRISVDLEVGHDNRIIAVIAAERSETLELLQRDAKALERALADAGLKTDSGSLSFNLQGQTDQQGGTDDGGKTASGSLNLPHENDEPEPQMAAQYDRATGHGGIDLRV